MKVLSFKLIVSLSLLLIYSCSKDEVAPNISYAQINGLWKSDKLSLLITIDSTGKGDYYISTTGTQLATWGNINSTVRDGDNKFTMNIGIYQQSSDKGIIIPYNPATTILIDHLTFSSVEKLNIKSDSGSSIDYTRQ